MPVYLVDPIAKAVTDVEGDLNEALEAERDFLDTVREMMKADRRIEQLAIIGLSGGQAAMIVDNFGMLRKVQAFWRLNNSANRIAGKAVVFAIADDGTLMPFPPGTLTVEGMRGLVAFDDVEVVKIIEQVVTTPGKVPEIARLAIYSDDPEPGRMEEELVAARLQELDQPKQYPETTLAPGASHPPAGAAEPAEYDNIALDTGWIVRALASGTVQAVRYVLEDDSIRPAAERLHADNLAELRKLMPDGYERQEPDDDAEPDILELWVLRDQRVASLARH